MLKSIMIVLMVVLYSTFGSAESENGLVAHWTFDEGSGDALRDASGNNNHGKLHGATWVKQGKGHALSFDGVNDYVDCGNGASLDLTKAVTLEAWIKPASLPANEPMIFGKYYDSYGLTHYRDGNTWFYISGGGNNASGHLEVGAWSHVVASFDGTNMTVYINREKIVSKKSKSSLINHGKNFLMGALMADPNATDPGYSGTSFWRGTLDEVRVYDRALSEEEFLSHYKKTAGDHGVDTSWFGKIRITTYPFRSEKKLLALVDFSGVFPRPPDTAVEASVVAEGSTEAILKREFKELPSSGMLCAPFALSELKQGNYLVRARLTASNGLTLAGEQKFQYPPSDLDVPSPAKLKAAALPEPPKPPRYSVELEPGGGFIVTVSGRRFPVESSFSYPRGGENRLSASKRDGQSKSSWQVTTKRLGKDRYEVVAKGKFYTIQRLLRVYPNRVNVQDTIRNNTNEDLGIILDNYLDAAGQPYSETTVAGYPGGVERKESQSPSSFVSWKDFGIGLLPLDDVYIVHSTVYAKDNRAGMKDDKFGLAPGASCTLEWAVYPTASPDYYDFLNAVRRDEGRNSVTVEGGFAFVPREPFTKEYAETRNLLYGSFGCLAKVADDPEIEIEGIDFLWLPKERARIKAEFEAIHKINPHLKLMFHVAHNLISTNKPETLFPDSRVMDANGKQVLYAYDYDACAYFSPQRHKEGWRWYIYYPMPGNSFHDAMMKSVDVMVDDIGCGGAFMDGFFYGYGSPYTYDRWDGHTVEMDPETKTIKRKVGSVLLLMQPSMVEFTKRMVAKGGVVIANNVIQTRTISSLPMIVDQECRTGPDVHLAQTPCALGNPTIIRNEVDLYKDVLDKLKFGNLYFYYGEPNLTYPSLPQQIFPITTEEIHAGTIKGKERIVTINSGVYGWKNNRDLHFCYRYNPVGVPIPAEFVTTVDSAGVRTQIRLESNESAVLKKVPLTLSSAHPVNLVCERYDREAISLVMNGRGRIDLRVRDGVFPVKPGARYSVSPSFRLLIADKTGSLRISLALERSRRILLQKSDHR